MEKYNQLTPEIIAQIQAVSEHVLVGDDINVDFARDEMQSTAPICQTWSCSRLPQRKSPQS